VKAIEGFSLIPQGAFTMGNSVAADTDLSDAPTRTVTLDAFYMGKYEVTKAEWDEVRTWGLSNGYTDLAAGSGKASNHPVQTITWYDMVKWCNARSQKDGLTPVYYTNETHTMVYKTGNVDVTNAQVKWSANGYRLPTEAEWEKAARGGLSGKRFPWGDTISHSQANYYALSSYSYDLSGTDNYHPGYATGSMPYTSPVGAFAANGYGLYDMAGNLFEWCWDWYGSYAAGSQTNSRGPSSGTYRVLRGGVWYYSGSINCRVALRSYLNPPLMFDSFGFRVVRSAVDTDSDTDGLVDSVETNTGVFVSASNTGTNPNNADTDADGVPDGLEVKEKTSPVDATKFNTFSKGLVAYYPFDGNTRDETGNGNHGVGESTALAPDRNGNSNHSYYFNGSSRIVAYPKSKWPNGNSDRTISIWMKGGAQLGNLFTFGDGIEANARLSLLLGWGGSGNLAIICESNDANFSNRQIVDNKWHHVCLVYDSSFFKVFIDGVLVETIQLATSKINTNGEVPLVLGSNSLQRNDEYFSGYLDDARIYDRALSTNEAVALFQAERPPFQIIEGSFTWHEAKADAEARGGRLAVLDTQAKIDEASSIVKYANLSIFIGLESPLVWGDWKWITGEPLTTSKWDPLSGEPNNWQGLNETTVVLGGASGNDYWSDVRGDDPRSYLLEFPDPKSVLTATTPTHGSITGAGEYDPGSTVTVTATPDAGYIFSGWTGDATGTTNPLSLTMDADKVVGANFEPDQSDSDGDGLTNYEELAIYYTNPSLPDTDGDGHSDAGEVQRGSDPCNPASIPAKLNNWIESFTLIPNNIYSDAPFLINFPTASSGLPVVVSIKSGPATISGTTVTLTGVGTVVLAANQAGNANYLAAAEVTTSFTVSKATQTISAFATISPKAFGSAPFAVKAPASTSGLPVTLSVKSGPATISGNTMTMTGVGTVVLAANQAGNANYTAATEVKTSFTVTKAAQTIAGFAIIGNKAYADLPFTVTAPVASSGLPVNLKVKSGPATISGNTVALTGVGTVILAANQAGNVNYLTAQEVTTSFAVSKATQTISAFSTITPKTFGAAPFAVTAPTSNRSLPVTLSVKSGPATISGNTVTLTGAGTVILAANQAGNANYLSAPEVTTSFTVSKATQTIGAFATIAPKVFGAAPFAVTAPTFNRSLPVTLSVKSGPATISGNTVTLTGAGTVVLAANQVGNANYLSAPEVTTSFTVSKATQTIGAFATITSKTFGVSPFTVTVRTTNRSLPVTLSVKSGPATISGNTVTLTGAGTVVLAANQVGNANYLSVTEVTTSFTVSKATQTIGAFTAISPKKLGSAPFAVTSPLASSKLPVVLKVKSGPANISGNTVTVTGVGTVVLAANQAGNDNYMSAREVTTSFKVTK
jgi:uncharacterized repeat protein (TIGR02543 family)